MHADYSACGEDSRLIVDLLRYDNFVVGLHIVLPAADYITRNQE